MPPSMIAPSVRRRLPDRVPNRPTVALVLLVAALFLLPGLATRPADGPIGAPTPRGPIGPASPVALDGRSTPSVLSARPAPSEASRPAVLRPGASGNATNSSPVDEVGGVVDWIDVAAEPYSAVYDPSDGDVYVTTAYYTDKLEALNGTKVVGTVPVGEGPIGGVYDPVDGDVYISNFDSDNVSVVNGMNLVATIDDASFNGPYQGVCDPSDGYVYIPNVGGSTVTVIDGTTVIASITVGTHPSSGAYDPVTHDVYVTNDGSVANGGSTISIINRTAAVGKISGNMTNPAGIAYDPSDGLFYVGNKNLTNPSAGFLTIFNTSSFVKRFAIGQDIFGVLYDPLNHYVYAASSDNDYGGGGRNVLSAFDGEQFVGNVSVGVDAHFFDFDAANDLLYVPNEGSSNLSLVSTLLAEGPVAATPVGDPADSLDLGQAVRLNASLWAPGTPTDVATLAAEPADGLGCPIQVSKVPEATGTNLTVRCTPTAPGNYTVWMNVTDGAKETVWAQVGVEVFTDPALLRPVATNGAGVPIGSADVQEAVDFSVSGSGGSGAAGPLTWSGLPSGSCGTIPTGERCLFLVPTSLNVSASITDTNGETATSPVLAFLVHMALVAPAPVATPARAEVGQTIAFSESPTGGIAPYGSFSWSGLNGTCTGVGTATPRCTFSKPMVLSIAVSLSDVTGAVASSAPLVFGVDPGVAVATPSANRSSADVGQTVVLSTVASGGAGPYDYSWTGLPPGCSSQSTDLLPCTPAVPGAFAVQVAVTDADGGRATSTGAGSFTVSSDPTVGAVEIVPSAVDVGQTVTLNVAVAGGSGTDHYEWLGLPSGCSGTRASIVCAPSRPGSFEVSVDVTDSNGFRSLSNQSALTVAAPPGGGFLGGSTAVVLYGGVGLVIVAGLVAVALLAIRRRRPGAKAGPGPG